MESVEDWIVREARAISGPRTHLQDCDALIEFGKRVAEYTLDHLAHMHTTSADRVALAIKIGDGLDELVAKLARIAQQLEGPLK